VEVLKRIRDMDAGIAVIVISGAGHLANASAALASGALACLQKPVDLQQFKQLVSDVLGHSQSPGQ
jgi:DNA-binding NtrC family response regulator